jgi:hypothetical protein
MLLCCRTIFYALLFHLIRPTVSQCSGKSVEMVITSASIQIPYHIVSTSFVATTLPAPTLGPLDLGIRNNSQQRAQISAVVGSTVLINFTAKIADLSQSVIIYVLEDPGVPNLQQPDKEGFRPQICLNDGCSSAVKQFIWSPYKGQEGMIHSICVLAIPSPSKSCQSSPLCMDIEVLVPNITFNTAVTPAPERLFHSPVGCSLEVCFTAFDAFNLYSIDLRPLNGTIPIDAQFDQKCSQVLQASASQMYYPLLSPSVQALSQLTAPLPCMRCLRWEAKRGMESQSFRPCVTAFDQTSIDPFSSLRTRNTCFNIFVPKCKYCVQAGDTLHYINKKYFLNTNWLQLWNSNGMPEIQPDPLAPAVVVGDPDWIADGNSIINLGPLYQVQPGETLQQLAALFRTTVKKLLDINPDVASSTTVAAGAALCVMPCTDAAFAAAAPAV